MINKFCSLIFTVILSAALSNAQESKPIASVTNNDLSIDLFSIETVDGKQFVDFSVTPKDKEILILSFKVMRPSVSEENAVCIVRSDANFYPGKTTRIKIESFLKGKTELGEGIQIKYSEKLSLLGRDIKQIKNDEAEQAKQERILAAEKKKVELEIKGYPLKIRKAIAEEKIVLGMTKRQLILSWGKPESINSTVTAAGRNEQWVYGSGWYVYFTNGIVSAWQTNQ